jgi:hypothetical protein
VSGVGLLPSVMQKVQIFSPLGEIGSHTIAFRNPFSFPLPVDVLLTGKGTEWVVEGGGEGEGI